MSRGRPTLTDRSRAITASSHRSSITLSSPSISLRPRPPALIMFKHREPNMLIIIELDAVFQSPQCLRRLRASITVDFDDSLGKGLRSFLRQIVPDAALDDAVRILAGEFLGIRTGVGMRSTVGITLKGHRRYRDHRKFGKALFQIIVLRFAFSQSESPTIVMDDDADVIRIVERCGSALECGIIEPPLRRSDLPNELRKIVPIFFVAGPAAFGAKIILVPPLELGLWWQGHLARFLTADQVTAHGHHGLAALRPECCDDVGCTRPPIKTRENRPFDLESIHESDGIDGQCRLLAIPQSFTGKKARRAVAAQIPDNNPVARLPQQGRDVDEAINIVGPAVQKNYLGTIGSASLSVYNVQDAGIDLLQCAEGRVCPRLDRRHSRRFWFGGLCVRRTLHA